MAASASGPEAKAVEQDTTVYTEVVFKRWDSGAVSSKHRNTYDYDADGRMIEYLSEEWNNGSWVNDRRTSYSYDSDGNRIEYLSETWQNGSWVNREREIYSRDDVGNLIEEVEQNWQNGSWVNSQRYSYSYDVDGNQTEFLTESWENGSWANDRRFRYSYSVNGNRTERLYETWQNGSWVNEYRETFSYGADGNLSNELDEDWQNGSWVNSRRYSYSYNLDGNRTKRLREYWDGSSWENSSRDTFTYDTDGNLTTQIDEYWRDGSWLNSYRRTYSYDLDGNRTERLNQKWENFSWVNDWRSSYSYDGDGNLTSYLGETWENGSWVKTYSDNAEYGVLLPPPSRAQAQLADGSATLSWPQVSHDSLKGYHLYRARGSFQDTSEATRLSGSLLTEASYSDEGLANGGRYYYRLAAVTQSGLQSGLSEARLAVPHPSEVTTNADRSFDEGTDTGDYRLVALPGTPGVALAETLPSKANWTAYVDDGTVENYLVEHDGSSTFDFAEGRGFWLVSDAGWSVSQTYDAASLTDSTTAIDLHDGWNIISNPLDKGVSWAQVRAANEGSLQPIWAFDNGSFVQTSAFASAKGGEAFYFHNVTGLDQLRVPYPRPNDASSSGQKGRVVAGAESAGGLSLTVYRGDRRLSAVKVGLKDGNKASRRNIIAPPSRFSEASLWVETEEASASDRQKRLAAVYKASAGDGTAFDLTLKSRTSGEAAPIRLEASGLSSLEGKSAALVEVEGGRSYNLRRAQSVTIRPAKKETDFRLLVGSSGFVAGEKEKLRPDELVLHQNYPNPFSEQTTLSYTLPDAKKVRLTVYDPLGREVAVLVNGRQQAGRHNVFWDGRGSGGPLSSGVYFTRLEAGGKRLTQKIVVVR